MSCRDSGSFRESVLMLGWDSTSAVLGGARSRAGLRPGHSTWGGSGAPAGRDAGITPGPLDRGAPGAGSWSGTRSTEIGPHLEDDPGGTVSYLLRLVVPDRPGILGAVATALGTAGIDIVSLDVLERGSGVAVDDVVVELPRGRLPDSLITAAQAVPGVTVESLRPFAGPLDTHRELELLEALARAAEGTAAKLLAAELPRVFHSGWAVVLEAAGDGWQVAAASEAAPAFEGADPAVDAAARAPAAAQRGRLAAGALAGDGHRDDGRALRRAGLRGRARPLRAARRSGARSCCGWRTSPASRPPWSSCRRPDGRVSPEAPSPIVATSRAASGPSASSTAKPSSSRIGALTCTALSYLLPGSAPTTTKPVFFDTEPVTLPPRSWMAAVAWSRL